jgi:hypothetical protein
VYIDPVRAPLHFAESLATNLPLLLGVELGGPQPDSAPFLSSGAVRVLVVVALAVLVWAGVVLAHLFRSSDERVRRTSRFLGLAAVIAVIPSTGTFPHGRLVLLSGIGFVGLLGLVCAGTLEHDAWASSRAVRAYAGWTWFGHLVLAPLLFTLNLHGAALLDGVVERLAHGVPADGSATAKRLVIVNAPDTAFAYYVLITHMNAGRSPPERMLILSGNRRDVRVTRAGERTLLVHEDGGFYRSGSELLTRDVAPPMPIGSVVALRDVTVTITHVLADGVPDEASFQLARDLETSYVFREWKGKDLVPFALPRIGETVTFPGRIPSF